MTSPTLVVISTLADESAVLWQGTSWEAGLAEAQAVVAAVPTAIRDGARERMQSACRSMFERAGQPLDAERCRLMLTDHSLAT